MNNIKLINHEQIKIFYSEKWSDYELLDTGEGQKLERFGPYTFVRPLEGAVWAKTLPQKYWDDADGKFWSSKTGAKAGWKMKGKIKEKWEMEYNGIKFLAAPTPFRHLGFFPEQAAHWDFIEKQLAAKQKNLSPLLHPSGGTFRLQDSPVSRPPRFLNLFGYTGVASLFALRAGAEVTHLDASKQTLKWAKENLLQNQNLSDTEKFKMRFIEDDALKFLEREAKRGNKYDAIIMDPPKYGRGPKGEIWKIEEMLPKLLLGVRKVLSDDPLFVILTSYSIDSSSLALGHALSDAVKGLKIVNEAGLSAEAKTQAGELCILEKSNGRLISLANTAVWNTILK